MFFFVSVVFVIILVSFTSKSLVALGTQVHRLISLVGESVLFGSLTTDLVPGTPVQWRTEYVITGANLPQVRSATLLSL